MKPRNQKLKLLAGSTLASVIVISFAATNFTFADTSWDGSESTDWTDPDNWSAGIPDPLAENGAILINDISVNTPALSTAATAGGGAGGFGDVLIGTGGNTGALNHSAGALSTNTGNWARVGDGSGSMGTYNMTGTASFNVDGTNFYVGNDSGTGDVNMSDSSSITSNLLLVGLGNGVGTLDVTGSAGITTGRLVVSHTGTGTLTVNTTGTVTANSPSGDWWQENAVQVGVDDGYSGLIDLDAGTIESTGQMWLGAFSGSGTLEQSGGTINTAGLQVGRYWNGSTGTTEGTATITGGELNSDWINIGAAGSGSDVMDCEMSVSGTGIVNSESDLVVGSGGTGTGSLTIGSGGTVNVGSTSERWMMVGRWDSTAATLTVNTGGVLNLFAGSDLRTSTEGNTGTRAINVNGGSIIGTPAATNDPSYLELGRSGAGGTDTLTIQNGGVVEVQAIFGNNGNATVNFDDGVFRAVSDDGGALILSGGGEAFILNGGADFDTNTFDITIAQPLLEDLVSTGGGLDKLNTGSLTLTGFCEYAGPTSVDAGALVFAGSGSNIGTVAVADDAEFGVRATAIDTTGVTAGDVTVGAGGNSTLSFDFDNINLTGSFDALVIGDAVTLDGTVAFDFANGSALTTGSIPLIEYMTSFSGTLPAGPFSFGTRSSGTLSNDTINQIIYLNVAADQPRWTGADSDQWVVGATGASGNWELVNALTATDYIEGDKVLFDDSAGSGNTSVAIDTADVSPESTSFDNSSFTYELSGDFGIAGTGGLTKDGTGSLYILNANTYSGPTTINSGVVTLGDGVDNGSIDGTSGVANDGSLIYEPASAQTAAYPISGTGSVEKTGASTLILSGANSYSGGTTVSQGTLQYNSLSGTAAEGTILIEGATLAFDMGTQASWDFTGGYTPTISLSDDSTLANVATGDPANLQGQVNLEGSLDGGGNELSVANTGNARLFLINTITNVSAIHLVSGATGLNIDTANNRGTAPIDVANGAALWYSGTTGNPIANSLTFDGGNGIDSRGALYYEGGTSNPDAITGPILLNADTGVGAQTGTDTIAIDGVVSGSGGWNLLSGMLTLNGVNTYTGDTNVASGSAVELSATGGLQFVIGAAGVNNKVTGAGTATMDGTFTFDVSGAAAAPNSWTIVDTTGGMSFGATFNVAGATESSDVWSWTDGSDQWQFDESTGILSVSAGGGFESWISGFTVADATPSGNSDADTLANVGEYWHDNNPEVSEGSAVAVVETGGNLVLTFQRSDAAQAAGDVTVYVEYGSGLTGWAEAAVPAGDGTVGGVTFTITDGTPTDTVVASVPITGTDFFARLKYVK